MSRLIQLEVEIEETRKKLDSLRALYFEELRTTQRNSAEKYQQEKKTALELGNEFKKHIKVGDLVKVTGTRSRSKTRKVLRIKDDGFLGIHHPKEDMITEHGYAKVTHIWKNERWITVKEFVVSACAQHNVK